MATAQATGVMRNLRVALVWNGTLQGEETLVDVRHGVLAGLREGIEAGHATCWFTSKK